MTGASPPILLLAAVLAAEGVAYVLVGSAGLYLRGWHGPVGDIDAVPVRTAAAGDLHALRARFEDVTDE
jgi:hypothetical protein